VDPQRNPRDFRQCRDQTHSQIAELQASRVEQSPMRLLPPSRLSPSQSRARGPPTEQAPYQSVQGERRI
jgi:hypothetical protein